MRNLKREAARRGAGSERSARHATEEPRATAATTTATTEKPTAGTTEKPMVMGARTSCTVDSHFESTSSTPNSTSESVVSDLFQI